MESQKWEKGVTLTDVHEKCLLDLICQNSTHDLWRGNYGSISRELLGKRRNALPRVVACIVNGSALSKKMKQMTWIANTCVWLHQKAASHQRKKYEKWKNKLRQISLSIPSGGQISSNVVSTNTQVLHTSSKGGPPVHTTCCCLVSIAQQHCTALSHETPISPSRFNLYQRGMVSFHLTLLRATSIQIS